MTGPANGSTAARRTVFAAFYTADPPTGGASAVTFNLARHWPGQRLLLQIGDKDRRVGAGEGFEVATLRQAGSGERLGKALQIPSWAARMAAMAAEFEADTVFLEGASWSVYHWLLGSLIRRALPAARIVYHAHNVEYDLRRQKHNGAVARLTRLAEARIVSSADVVTAVSEVDAQRIAGLYGRRPLLLPNGVDLEWLRSVSPEVVADLQTRYGLTGQTVLFMGAYAYRPNGEAIDFLVTQVFPALVEKVPDARLLILGGEVPHRAPWLIAPGLVPAARLPAFIASSAVSVAPIFSGSGTRLKILESLAARIPVVATAKGAEGLPVDHCDGFQFAETACEFIEAVIGHLHRPASPKPFSMVDRFAWPAIIGRFEIMLGSEDR